MNNFRISTDLFYSETENNFYISVKDKAYKFDKNDMLNFYHIINDVNNNIQIDLNCKYTKFLIRIKALEFEQSNQKIEKINIQIPDVILRYKLSNLKEYKTHFIFTDSPDDWLLIIFENYFLLGKNINNFMDILPADMDVCLEYIMYCLEVIKEKKDHAEFIKYVLNEQIIQFDLTNYFNKYKPLLISDISGDNLEDILYFQSFFSNITYDFDELFPYVKMNYSDVKGNQLKVLGENKEICMLNILYFLWNTTEKTHINIENLKLKIRKDSSLLSLDTFSNLFFLYSLGEKIKIEEENQLKFIYDKHEEMELSCSLFLTKYLNGDYNE